MLRKKGIKSTPEDGPITEHPQFSRIQWNQSYSHMPQGHQARVANELEMMDMDEPGVPEWVELAVEPTVEPAVEPTVEPYVADEEEEYEETITIRALDLLALQDSLDDMRFKIANIERDARQAQLEAEERFDAQQSLLWAIIDRLPPTPWGVEYSNPLHYICIFCIHTLWTLWILSLGVCVHILFLIMQFILNYGLIFFCELNLMNMWSLD
jgi:hypothetical protein